MDNNMNFDQSSQASYVSLPGSVASLPAPLFPKPKTSAGFGQLTNSSKTFSKPTAASTPTLPQRLQFSNFSEPSRFGPNNDQSTLMHIKNMLENQKSANLAHQELVNSQFISISSAVLAMENRLAKLAVTCASVAEKVNHIQMNQDETIELGRADQTPRLNGTDILDAPQYELRSGPVGSRPPTLPQNKTPSHDNPSGSADRNRQFGQGDHVINGRRASSNRRNGYNGQGDFTPRFNDNNDYLDGYTIKDAKHRSFRLTENHSSIPKFDPACETIGYFMVGRLFPFTESINLPAIQYIDGWLQNALPTVPSIKLNNAKNKARSRVNDNEVREYLLRLARLLHGQGRKLSPIAFKRTFQENLSSYAERLMIEFNTVFKQSYDEFHSENELVRDVYYHITCNEEKEIRTSLNQTVKYMRLGNIDSLDKLREITQSVDEILITLDDSNIGIASHQEVSAFTSQHNYKNTTFTNNPYVSPHNSPQEKVKCEGVNNNGCKNMFSTDRGYKKCHECHMKSTWIKCISCNTDFLADRSTNKRCRDCYYKQRRSQSVDRNSKNSVPQTSSSNERGRPPHRNVASTAEVEQDSTPDDLYVLSGPVFGDELEMNSNDISPETIASVLKRFDCHLLDVQPVSKSRIFIDFSHKSGEKGSCLIDTGANVDTMSEDFCKRANLPINRQESSKVRDYKGDVCATPGKVRTTINIGLVEHSTNYTVISTSLGPDVILGIPFLNRFGLVNSLRTKLTNITGKDTTDSISPKN